jgi:hypothetical protein
MGLLASASSGVWVLTVWQTVDLMALRLTDGSQAYRVWFFFLVFLSYVCDLKWQGVCVV